MNPLKTLLKFSKNKGASVQNGLSEEAREMLGAPSVGLMNSMMTLYHSDHYASAFPSIRAITNEYMTVLPRAIDSNGKTVQNNPIVNALFHPNQLDSVIAFNEKVAVSTLVNKKTYLLVWRNDGGVAKPGGDFGFKGKNIAGFTFLERPAINRRDGKTFYNVGAQEFTEDEVLVIPAGVNPNHLYEGYSPTEASVKWITLDDYIADFQKGFFENNAIPAGMFVITAPSTQEYKDIVSKLQARHRGAGNNNNVTYSHKPVDPNTGKPAQAQIEWIPFQQPNKDIDFKSLFEQANKRIDLAFGVPQIVKGVDDAATYANAQVAEATFAKRAVRPLLLRNYAQITHELNRITGGIGVAITFDYDIPAVSDQEKVEAERDKIHADLVSQMVEAGFTLGSVVDAFDLPKRLKLLSITDKKESIKNDKPEVDEGKEVTTAPDPDEIDGIKPLDTVKSPRSATSPDPAIDDSLIPYEKDISTALNNVIDQQVERTLAGLSDSVEDDEDDSAAAEIAAVLLLVLLMRGKMVYEAGVDMALSSGLITTDTTKFSGSMSDVDESYVYDVTKGFNDTTRDSLIKTVAQHKADGLSDQEIKNKLASFKADQSQRVERFAKNEAWRVSEIAGLKAMNQLDGELNDSQKVGTYKTWKVQQSACPQCLDYADISVKVDKQFFGGLDAPPAHVTCRCILSYSIVKEEDLEMRCGSCDRFLGTTTQKAVTDKIKCSNSKCKSLDVPVIKEPTNG